MTMEAALSSNRARVGLVLSGGGAMAAYQAGVVKALDELDVEIHAVAGASAGALNGLIVAEAGGDLGKAADQLEGLWKGLIDKSPIEWRLGKFFLNVAVLGFLARAPGNPWVLMTVLALKRAGLVELSLADAVIIEKHLDRCMQNVLRGEGLPLYVSILESENILTDLSHVAGNLSDLWDTPPAGFRHIQSLSRDEQKATILASAAIPIVFQARRLGPDGRRNVDGGLGGWRERQGNTPATPLVEDAGCTHLIVTHASDGSPWRRDRFPGTEVIEIRPGRTMKRVEGFMGDFRDMFNFSGDILSWIEQGHEDTMRCVGDVKRALDVARKSTEASVQRDRAVAALDEDGFGSD